MARNIANIKRPEVICSKKWHSHPHGTNSKANPHKIFQRVITEFQKGKDSG